MDAIEKTRKYAEENYFPKYGWFQIDEEPDGINIFLDHPDAEKIWGELEIYFNNQ